MNITNKNDINYYKRTKQFYGIQTMMWMKEYFNSSGGIKIDALKIAVHRYGVYEKLQVGVCAMRHWKRQMRKVLK